jgi:hypothetical protein
MHAIILDSKTAVSDTIDELHFFQIEYADYHAAFANQPKPWLAWQRHKTNSQKNISR